ncbi:MAG TPA: hypothetical protein VII01_02620 [Solirubrobacteraceae bacterium]
MPRIDEQDQTPSKDARISSQSGEGHPRLRPVTDEEQERAEGETTLTFLRRPPDPDE